MVTGQLMTHLCKCILLWFKSTLNSISIPLSENQNQRSLHKTREKVLLIMNMQIDCKTLQHNITENSYEVLHVYLSALYC